MGDRARRRADERRHEESLDEARRSRRWAAVGAVGTLVAIAVAIAIAVVQGEGSSTGGLADAHAGGSVGGLELVDAVVGNGLIAERDPARIDVKLHNTGMRRVILRRATIVVEQVEQLSFCYSQGDLPVSEDYPVILPAEPGTVEVPLNQQLGADAADRITLSLGPPEEPAGPGSRPHIYVYRLHMTISQDGGDDVDAGQFVVAAPNVPAAVEWYWPHRFDGMTRDELSQWFGPDFPYERLMPCWRLNTLRLRSVLDSPGERSDELARALDDLSLRPEPPPYD